MWAIVIIILTGTLAIAPGYYTFGQTPSQVTTATPSQEQMDESIHQINENNRSIERFGLFAKHCTDLVKSNNLTHLPTCDAVLQKFNIDIGKFFAENQGVIESIIYPYTLPPDIQNKLTLNNSDAIGSSERSVLAEHSAETGEHMRKIQMLSKSCIGARSMITECMDVFSSLNDHFKDFNKNTQAEFDQVLASPSGSLASLSSQGGTLKVLSSNSFIDGIGFYHVVGEIENGTPDSISYVQATATFYDKNDNVVGTSYSYTNPSDLGPGEKAPFEIILTSASIPINQIDHHNIIVSHD